MVSFCGIVLVVRWVSFGLRGVDRLDLLAIAALYELSIDVQPNGLVVFDTIGSCQFDGKVGRHLEG